MVRHLFLKYLEDRTEYQRASDYWVSLWDRIDPFVRELSGWRQPWLCHGLSEDDVLMDGNPIFSAYTPQHGKGIRIIQYPPTSGELEWDFWYDTFGGSMSDPNSIEELVIACALSEEAAMRTFEWLSAWVRGRVAVTYPELPQFGAPVIGASGPAYEFQPVGV